MSYFRYGRKQEAERLKKISIIELKKDGYLNHVHSFAYVWKNEHEKTFKVEIMSSTLSCRRFLRLRYDIINTDSKKEKLDYFVDIEITRCNFGKYRYWLTCPFDRHGYYCGRRVGVLYFGGKYFSCRKCLNLSYRSKNLNRRSKNFFLYKMLVNLEKIDKLEAFNRTKYAGKQTKKQRKIKELQRKMPRRKIPP